MTTGTLPALERVTCAFRALSDETRVRILELLRGGELCVCELMDALDVPQSLLSFHLKCLKDTGLVTARRQGRWMYYAAVPQSLRDVAGCLEELSGGQG